MSCHSFYVHTSPFLDQEEATAYQWREQDFYLELSRGHQSSTQPLLVRFQQCRQACIAAHLICDMVKNVQKYRATAQEDGSKQRPYQSKKERVSCTQYSTSIPHDWRGTSSTKMKLLRHYATERLLDNQKMLVLSSYVQALLIAQEALRGRVRVFILVRAFTSEIKLKVLHDFQTCKEKAVLLLSYAALESIAASHIRVARILILDSDWDSCMERHQLHRFLKPYGIMTRLLMEDSLELQLYIFLKSAQRKRKRDCKFLRVSSIQTVNQILHMSGSAEYLCPAGDEEAMDSITLQDSSLKMYQQQQQQQEEEEKEAISTTPMTEDHDHDHDDSEFTKGWEHGISLLHPLTLSARKYIPMGVCVFGLSLNHQSTCWYLDPVFLLEHLYSTLYDYAILLNTSTAFTAEWLTTQSVSIRLSWVNRPIHRQQLPTHQPIPDQVIRCHCKCSLPLMLDSKQFLYFDYFYHYYHHSGCLPCSLFPVSGLLSPQNDNKSLTRPWQLPPISHLINVLFLCKNMTTSTATSLFLAMLYRDTSQHRVYYYHQQTNLSEQPLLFYRTGNEIRLLSCDTCLLPSASAALCCALQEGGCSKDHHFIIHVPLYFGENWLEELDLPGIRIVGRLENASTLTTCYDVEDEYAELVLLVTNES